MGTRFEQFMAYQLEMQLGDKIISPYKRTLDFGPFREKMNQMTNFRYRTIEKLVVEKTVMEIQKGIASGLFTYGELIIFYMKRIQEYDVDRLNSIIELNPFALVQAEVCDKRIGLDNHPLYGIPIVVKDNILSGSHMRTTAGCHALSKVKSPVTAPIIDRLESFGAIIIGKANLSQWAFYMSEKGVCGYSAVGGQCKNPYGPFGVGGSSSGSAVAVSANFCMLAIGTETCGSVINPSAQNGIVGIYPSRNLLPGQGIIPISKYLDTAGPMARTVEDAALVLEVLSKERVVQKKGLKRRIGIVMNEEIRESGRSSDLQVLSRISGELERIGMEVNEIGLDQEMIDIDMDPILEYEFNHSIHKFFKNAQYPFNDLSDIIRIYQRTPEMAPYGYDLMEVSVNTKITESENLWRFEHNEAICRKGLDKVFEQYDALMSLGSQLAKYYASAGYPSISVPAGYRDSGEPVGVTFTAVKGGEKNLLDIASLYERSTQYRKNPLSF